MGSTSPTQLTLRKLRAEGWTCAVVEHWNSFAKIRQDLFGFGDILCFKKEDNVGIVQCTTKDNMGARIKKIKANRIAQDWPQDGGRWLEVWGWYKNKGKWEVKVEVM